MPRRRRGRGAPVARALAPAADGSMALLLSRRARGRERLVRPLPRSQRERVRSRDRYYRYDVYARYDVYDGHRLLDRRGASIDLHADRAACREIAPSGALIAFSELLLRTGNEGRAAAAGDDRRRTDPAVARDAREGLDRSDDRRRRLRRRDDARGGAADLTLRAASGPTTRLGRRARGRRGPQAQFAPVAVSGVLAATVTPTRVDAAVLGAAAGARIRCSVGPVAARPRVSGGSAVAAGPG